MSTGNKTPIKRKITDNRTHAKAINADFFRPCLKADEKTITLGRMKKRISNARVDHH
jgi:hypothetical protein